MDFDKLRDLARTSLSAYASVMHHDWNPNWHHRVIARMLERFASNEPGWEKVILSLPPRSGKTELVSKLFPGWYMAGHPHENVIVATYGGELSDDLGRKAREYVSTELFESIMGETVSRDTNAITKWELTNKSTFFATSIGGALTGRGASCLTGDTRVMTDKGEMTIEAVMAAGKSVRVLSKSPEGLEFKRVKAFQRSTASVIYSVHTMRGRVVDATADHLFYTERRGWVEAAKLHRGDALYSTDGVDYARVVEATSKECFVYDIQVADNHNFFANGVLVHNCLIVDDPVRNREDADSESSRQKTWDWFTSTAFTRLEKNGKVLIVMTRWHEDDLAGRLLASNSGWREVKFPAVAEESDEFRETGEPLWPDKYPTEKLEEIRAQIGMRDWASLYQQRPAPQDGDVFRATWLKTYKSLEALEREGVVFEAVYQSWDTAVSGKTTSARSACTTWGVYEGKYYLLHTFAEPLAFPELRSKAVELARLWEPDMIYIEEQQTGRPLIDELKRHLGNRMTAVRPKGTKEARARASSVLFETGKVYLPEDAPWLGVYVQELLGFPSGKFMDRVDSTTLVLNVLMKQSRTREGAWAADNPYATVGRSKAPNIYSR